VGEIEKREHAGACSFDELRMTAHSKGFSRARPAGTYIRTNRGTRRSFAQFNVVA